MQHTMVLPSGQVQKPQHNLKLETTRKQKPPETRNHPTIETT